MSRIVFTACPYDCPDGCGIVAEIDGSCLVSARGRKDHPITRGFLCRKGRRWPHILNSPARLRRPLLKRQGCFEEIGWDKALEVAASEIDEALRMDHRAFLFFESAGNMLLSNQVQAMFPGALGGGTQARGSLCNREGLLGLKAGYKKRGFLSPETVAHSSGILLWGRNVRETNLHFHSMVQASRRKGALVGSIDIRPTPTGRSADREWIVRPGSDLTLALFLCSEILREDRNAGASGDHFELFRELVQHFDRSTTMEKTGLSLSRLDELRRFVLSHRPLSIWLGVGPQRISQGMDLARAVDALSYLTGNHDLPGGGVGLTNDISLFRGTNVTEAQPSAAPRFVPRPQIGRTLLTLVPPIRTAMFVRGDPVNQCGASGLMRRFLENVPFSICLDYRLSPTAALCNLVLPVSLFLERETDYVVCNFTGFVQQTNPVVPPLEQTRDEIGIMSELLQRLGYEDILSSARRRIGMAVTMNPALTSAAEGIWRLRESQEHEGTFRFPDRLSSLQKASDRLRLITIHREDFINGQCFDLPEESLRLRARLSPQEAAGMGLSEGRMVTLENTMGTLRSAIETVEGMAHGTVVLDQGLPGVNDLVSDELTPSGNNCLEESWVHIRGE